MLYMIAAFAHGPDDATTTEPAPVQPAPVEPTSDEPAPITDAVPIPVVGASAPEDDPFPVKVGIGLFFSAGGAFMQQPQDRTHADVAGELPFSGMAGFSPGAGGRFEVQFFDAIGFEVQLFRGFDKMQSKYTVNGTDVGFAVRQPSWHVPIHLQLAVPGTILRPYLFGGVEVVVPSDASMDSPAGIPWRMTASAKTWHMWSFGFGFEAKMNINKVDLRVPIQFRGSATAPYSTIAQERAVYTINSDGAITSMHYDMRWQYYASINVGLSWFLPG